MSQSPPPVISLDERRRTALLIALTSLFVGAYICADIIGGNGVQFRLFGIGPDTFGLAEAGAAFTVTMGVLAFPFTFILTDIINEYFGRRVVRAMTICAAGALLLLLPVIMLAAHLPNVAFSDDPFWKSQEATEKAIALVLSPAATVVAGSIIAFLIGQLLDAWAFSWLRRKTGGRMLWLRAQGSTLFSQVIDSFVVIYLAFIILPQLIGRPPMMDWSLASKVAITNYVLKSMTALLATPVLYLIHGAIRFYLGNDLCARMTQEAHGPTPVR